jgi:hypothetical protein
LYEFWQKNKTTEALSTQKTSRFSPFLPSLISVMQSREIVLFGHDFKNNRTLMNTDSDMSGGEHRTDGTDFCRGFCPTLAGKRDTG